MAQETNRKVVVILSVPSTSDYDAEERARELVRPFKHLVEKVFAGKGQPAPQPRGILGTVVKQITGQ